MMSKIVNDWLEEGYIESGTEHEVRRLTAFIPTLTNKRGVKQTPKPLFFSFLDETQLEPEFMPKYLADLENKFRQSDTINLDKYISKDIDNASPEEEIYAGERILIEYDRKNIFLSRVMFNLFEMPDSSVQKGSPEYSKVLEKNQLYQNALERHKNFPDSFEDQYIQTDLIDTVEKQIATMPMIIENKSCMIDNYLFKEHYNRHEMKVKAPPKSFTKFFDDKTKFCDYKEFLAHISTYPESFMRIQDALYVTEKTLDYNTHKNCILEYNGCETDLENVVSGISTAENSKELLNNSGKIQSPDQMSVKHHLRFYFEKLGNDFQVTCMECCPLNPNIFVAGYGVSKFKEMDHEPRGMVLCWNIHKSGYPEKIYYTEEIVTSLEFSKSVPYLVAVGMRYGLITTFYLCKSETSTSINNYSSKVKPIGAVKNIRWVKKKYAMGKEIEMLLSVSMDGIICSWICGRKLDGHILRYIKRGSDVSEEGQRLMVAIDAGGTCMQFKPNDNEIFIIGTVEGEALEANINDPDCYIHVYKCHNGPVYDLQWSPLVKEVFMTTGTDRFIHIWQMGKRKPSKSLTVEDVVLKVAWSYVKSTLFAALSKSKILIFDLSIDLHTQIAEYTSKSDVIFTSLSYCPRNNWFLAGQSNGTIDLCELVHISDFNTEQEEALKKTFLSDS